MLGLGPPELVIILVLVLLVFGAGKLPQVAGALGKGIREFRHAAEGNTTPAPPAVPTVAAETPERNVG